MYGRHSTNPTHPIDGGRKTMSDFKLTHRLWKHEMFVPLVMIGSVPNLEEALTLTNDTFSPVALLHLLTEEAREAGAMFRYSCEAGPQDLDAEIVVIASGSWSRQVGAALGVELAVEAVERRVFQVVPGITLPDSVPFIIDAANGWAMRERDGRLLILPPGDASNWEETCAWLERSIPAASFDRPEDHWTGFYE